MSKWISAEEELPNKDGVYLCYCAGMKHIRVWCKVYDAERKQFNDCTVTHWQPLPPPP